MQAALYGRYVPSIHSTRTQLILSMVPTCFKLTGGLQLCQVSQPGGLIVLCGLFGNIAFGNIAGKGLARSPSLLQSHLFTYLAG